MEKRSANRRWRTALWLVTGPLLVACAASGVQPNRTPEQPILQADTGPTMMSGGDGGNPEPEGCQDKPKYLIMKFLQDGTHIDIGTSGQTYDVAMMREAFSALEVGDCESDCNRCQFHGPVRHPSGANMQRCVSDTSHECTSDADCPGSTCAFFLGSHSISRLIPDTSWESSLQVQFLDVQGEDHWPITGDINFVTGEINIERANFRFWQWLQTPFVGAQSASCTGDPTPNDGQRQGTCQYGTRTGPCDVNGKQGRGTKAINRDTSLDCPLLLGTGNTTYFDLNLAPLKTGLSFYELTADSPDATGGGGRKSWCALCQDGTPCNENRDCVGIGTTHLCGEGLRAPKDSCIKPTIFDPDYESSCTPMQGNPDRGTCVQATFPFANIQCHPGKGLIGAKLNAYGSQSVDANEEVRSVVSGVACLPRSTNGDINNAIGLPGEARLEIEVSVQRIY